jgi:hypothetical protein
MNTINILIKIFIFFLFIFKTECNQYTTNYENYIKYYFHVLSYNNIDDLKNEYYEKLNYYYDKIDNKNNYDNYDNYDNNYTQYKNKLDKITDF